MSRDDWRFTASELRGATLALVVALIAVFAGLVLASKPGQPIAPGLSKIAMLRIHLDAPFVASYSFRSMLSVAVVLAIVASLYIGRIARQVVKAKDKEIDELRAKASVPTFSPPLNLEPLRFIPAGGKCFWRLTGNLYGSYRVFIEGTFLATMSNIYLAAARLSTTITATLDVPLDLKKGVPQTTATSFTAGSAPLAGSPIHSRVTFIGQDGCTYEFQLLLPYKG